MKRSFLFRLVAHVDTVRTAGVVAAGTGLIAATYGLVRLAYGLFLPDVQAELSFDAAVAGWISSGASVVYCVGAVVGFFSAWSHPRLLVGAAALTASVGAVGMASSVQAGTFAIFSILGSAGAGLASAALVTIVGRNVSASGNSRSQAMVNAGTGPGLVAAGILALLLLPDWRLAWALVAVFTVGVAGAVLILDRAPKGHPQGPQRGVPPRSWFVTHRLIIVAAFLMGSGSAAVWNYGRTLLGDAGMNERVSISAWIALGVGGTAVIGSARLMSRLSPRVAWTVTTIVVAAASTALAMFPSSMGAALVACAAFGWGYTAGTNALIAWTIRIDADRAASGTSLLFVVLVLGQAVGASAVGSLVTGAGFTVAFLAAAVITFAAAVVPILSSARRVSRPLPERGRTERVPTR
jgi:predicted MFS family arabinose efflux permease